MWLGTVLVALGVAVSLVAGCGGSADDSGTNTGARAAFIKDGDAICRNGEKKAEIEIRLNGEFYGAGQKGGPTKAQEEALLEDIVLPSIQEQAEALGKLKPPSGDEEQIEAIVRDIEKGVAESKKTPAEALEKPGPFAEVSKLAKEYGFNDCGQK